MLYAAIGKCTPCYTDFEFAVSEANHLVNKRPICFKEALRDSSTDGEIPIAITPEMILHGYELVSINVIPDLEAKCDEWKPPGSPKSMFETLSKIRSAMAKIYSDEFIPNLIKHATDIPGRFRLKYHHKLEIGDIVLVKDQFVKRGNMPMARVKKIFTNDIDEVTHAIIIKGNREEMTRHVNCLIPLLEIDSLNSNNDTFDDNKSDSKPQCRMSRPSRKTAVTSATRTKALVEEGLV